MAQFQKGDMSPELKPDVLALINEICAEYKDDDGIASNLKKRLDSKFTPPGSYVTHEKEHLRPTSRTAPLPSWLYKAAGL
uniref:H15 domain-containing protein n=1 Tax=Macrostomum lignano TaxID=282301 RepID=A0A1I8FDC9_9PLAT